MRDWAYFLTVITLLAGMCVALLLLRRRLSGGLLQTVRMVHPSATQEFVSEFLRILAILGLAAMTCSAAAVIAAHVFGSL